MRNLFFYVWWLLADGLVYYLALDFLLDVAGTRRTKWHVFIWITGNAILIILSVYFRLPGMFLLDILCLLLYTAHLTR